MGVKRVISIHALREEGDDEPEGLTNKKTISIHALREEGDLVHLFRAVSGFDFYPRPPRGGRRAALLRTWQATCISIHALREEGDTPPFFPYFV